MKTLALPTIKAEITFTSYDSSQRGYYYSIQTSWQDADEAKPRLSQIKRRRFREFLSLYNDYVKDTKADLDNIGPFPCSKYVNTLPEQRKPKLEQMLNKMIQADLKMDAQVSKRVQRFLGLDLPTALPPKPQSFEDFELSTLDKRKVQFAHQSFVVMCSTALVFHFVDTKAAFAVAVVLCLSLALWHWRYRKQLRAQYSQQEKQKLQAAQPVDLSLVCKEKDGTLTPQEVALLPALRSRLVDFSLGTSGEYDEWFLNTHREAITALTADPVSATLTPQEARKRAWETNAFKDYRLALFLRFNANDLDAAESQARFVLTTRMALRLDTFLDHRENRPMQRAIDYAGSALLDEYTKLDVAAQRIDRLERFWLRDRDGALCMFTRIGHASTRKMFQRIFLSNDAQFMKMALWFLELFRSDADFVHEHSAGRTVPAAITLVVDMEGFSMQEQLPTNDLLALVKKYVPLVMPGYGGVIKRVVVVNAPWYVNVLLGLVGPFMPKEIMNTVEVHSGCDLNKHLRTHVEDKYIPKYLGGQLVGGGGDDPYCTDRLLPAGPFRADKGEALFAGK